MSFAFVLLIFWRFTLFHFSSLTYCVYCCLRSCVVLYTSLIFCLFILLVVNRFELCLSICCFILSYHCFVECFSLHLYRLLDFYVLGTGEIRLLDPLLLRKKGFMT